MVILHDVKPTRRCAGGVALAVSGVLANAENSHLARSLARQFLPSSGWSSWTPRACASTTGVTPTFFSNALIRTGRAGWFVVNR